jgi:hypothetical protein
VFRKLLIALSVCSFVACSAQSPVAPSGVAASGGLEARPSAGVPGIYGISFWARIGGVWQEVSSLPVLSSELLLRADVTDLSGNPATAGTVTFEYCSYPGRPNLVTDADEAPKEACEQGQAKWARLDSWNVGGLTPNCLLLGGGSACAPFGMVRIPRSIGFRFRYAQKGGIASGTSPARNFVWTAQLP